MGQDAFVIGGSVSGQPTPAATPEPTPAPTAAPTAPVVQPFVIGPFMDHAGVLQDIRDHLKPLDWSPEGMIPSTAKAWVWAQLHRWTNAELGEAMGFTEAAIAAHFARYGY